MQKTATVETVIEGARNEMIKLAYSKSTIANHKAVWKKFRAYAEKQGEPNFTAELAEDFLRETFNYPQTYTSGIPTAKKTINKIRSIRILQDFHFIGTLPGKLMPPPTECPKSYKSVYESFRAHCTIEGRTSRCLRNYERTALQFALFLEEHDIHCYGDISASDVDAFIIRQQGFTKHTVKMKFQTLKIFLRYLHSENYVTEDFSVRVPRVRVYAKGKIPSTLNGEQTERLIASFDRGSPIGKRDYAIVLLAIELGLRSSDISNLRFDNIDWAQKRIRIIQEKTQKALELPMPISVTNAIIEYMKHGRPKSKVPFVFVQHVAPYGQYNELWNVMQRALRSTGIYLEEESSKGLHILRHTLGTNLLKNGVPPSTIAEIFGQRNITTTEIYLHTDTDGLRKCAIDPEVLVNG